jgi:hypothetical protein
VDGYYVTAQIWWLAPFSPPLTNRTRGAVLLAMWQSLEK